MTSDGRDAIVVGSGIVGLAIAYALAKRGRRVTVVERESRAKGASVRNFGLVWPVGQPPGDRLKLALRSREIWKTVAGAAGCDAAENGCLHLAYAEDEMAVLEEFVAAAGEHGYRVRLLTGDEVAKQSPGANPENLRGGMLSETEITVNPRQALARIPEWLAAEYGVEFIYNTAVTAVEMPAVVTGGGKLRAEHVFVCSGSDFETLYPGVLQTSPLRKCKLQMMKTGPQPNGWRLGPSLCAGLTLRHYPAFEHCPSVKAVRERFARLDPRLDEWGIQILLSQNADGELIIGDSHEYGDDIQPFDREEVNRLILDSLFQFARFPDTRIIERWHGIYAKSMDGAPFFEAEPETGVTIVNGLGGAGMTLSFGLGEKIVAGRFD